MQSLNEAEFKSQVTELIRLFLIHEIDKQAEKAELRKQFQRDSVLRIKEKASLVAAILALNSLDSMVDGAQEVIKEMIEVLSQKSI